MKNPTALASACLAALDSGFLKALAEPARIEVLKVLVTQGRSDVGSIAAQLPQDRSVIARHLQVLERARLVSASTEGRFTYYEIDGDGVMEQLRSLQSLFSALAPLCCPPADTTAPAMRASRSTR
jgi:DNA-binding transcriptional ArsR family regulator